MRLINYSIHPLDFSDFSDVGCKVEPMYNWSSFEFVDNEYNERLYETQYKIFFVV